jgi:GTPase SAR1 family protein
MVFEDVSISLEIHDTYSSEEFARIRGLQYYEADLVMIMFAVNRPLSLESVEAQVRVTLFLLQG